MSESAGRTVADCLHDLEDLSAVDGILQLLDGDCDQDDLVYEDWVLPMKLTGGEIVLATDSPIGFDKWWFRYAARGLEGRSDAGIDLEGVEAVEQLSMHILTPAVDVRPVLRSETPFGGED